MDSRTSRGNVDRIGVDGLATDELEEGCYNNGKSGKELHAVE